jgi:hypothetical protein
MAENPKIPVEVPMPESLHRQLDEFRRKLWRTKITEAVLAGICGLLFSFLLIFALDRVWQTAGVVRLAVLLGGTSLAAVFAPIWLHRWVWGHREEDQLARLIAKRFPGLGDRLLGIVELQGQMENADTLSPQLRAAAMRHVAAEAERRSLHEALPATLHRRWALAVVIGLLLAGVGFVISPKAGLSSMKRWLLPFSNTPRYTFTELDAVPRRLTVPQGEAFSLTLQLTQNSAWQPANGTAQYGRQDPLTATLQPDRRYRFEFPAQQDPGIVRLEIGDAKHAIQVIPTLRPSISKVTAQVEPPAYLQLPQHELDLSSGILSAVQGSKVKITTEATRELAAAHYGPLRAEGIVTNDGGAMQISGAIARTPAVDVAEKGFTVPITWTDALGLEGEAGFEVRVDALLDAAPTIYIQGVPRQHAMLAEETVNFEVTSEDDFGIRKVGLEWSGEFTSPTDQAPTKGELKILDGGPTMSRLTSPTAFAPVVMDIQPQKLTLRAWTEDYLPGRARSYSEPITLFILTRDEHAQMLKGQFDRVIGELEDLARKERGLLEENQRIEKLDPAEIQTEENRKRLDSQEEGERQQAEKMGELTKKMQQLFKDTARNGSIEKDTLKKMAETTQSMKELAEADIPAVKEKLDEAQDQKSTEEKAKEDVTKAVDQQQAALEKMQKMIENANDANQQFEASTFVNRLKKAATEEDNVGNAVWQSYESTAALARDDLDPADEGALKDTIKQQLNTASDVRWIQEDLGHFFTRTNKESYREILNAMKESRIDIGLEDLRRLLEINHGFLSKEQASHWAAKLNEWAQMLSKAQKQGGGSGGPPPPPDEDFEFMLRVMRMIQQEQDIRARTRALETLRRSYETP